MPGREATSSTAVTCCSMPAPTVGSGPGALVTAPNGSRGDARRQSAHVARAAVAYGHGLLVRDSRSGSILASSNATHWLPRPFDAQLSLDDITLRDGRFVAVGGGGENLG